MNFYIRETPDMWLHCYVSKTTFKTTLNDRGGGVLKVKLCMFFWYYKAQGHFQIQQKV